VNKDAYTKIEQANGLIGEVHQLLKEYRDGLVADGVDDGRLAQAQEALDSVHSTWSAMPLTRSLVWKIAEQHGKPPAIETVQVEVTIEPRFRDGCYTENTLLEIPAGLSGQAREDAIIDAAASEVVNEQVPWGAQEVEES